MKWRFVYPWHGRVTLSSSILILRLLSHRRLRALLPLFYPNVPSRFPSTTVAPSSFSPFRPFIATPHPYPLLPSVRPLNLLLSSPPSSPILLLALPRRRLVSLAKKFTFAKKGKKARKIDARRRLAARGRVRAGIGAQLAHGRGLKMSSRCVIAYIDPTVFGVYAAPINAIHPHRKTHSFGVLPAALRVHGRDASTGAIANVPPPLHIASPAPAEHMHYVRGAYTGWLEEGGNRYRSFCAGANPDEFARRMLSYKQLQILTLPVNTMCLLATEMRSARGNILRALSRFHCLYKTSLSNWNLFPFFFP